MKKASFVLLIFCLFCTQERLFSQSNVFQIHGTADLIYSQENSVSTSFFERENGNLKLKNVFGYGISYLKGLDSKNSIFLKVGIENKHQHYSINYFSFFPDENNSYSVFDFTRYCTNLRIGVLKQKKFFNEKLEVGIGLDLLSRNYRTTFTKSFDIDAPNFVNADATFFSFNTFSNDKLWPVQIEVSGSVGYGFNEKISIFSKMILSPRESLSFNYNVTSVDVDENGGMQNKQIYIEEKLSNAYVFRSLRFDVGLSFWL